METHLVVYKSARLLDEVSKQLAGFRARDDGTPLAARIADIAQQVDEARSELRDLRNEL